MTAEKAILTALDRVAPYLLPEATLLTDVNTILAAPIGYTDLRTKLTALEGARMILSVAPNRTLGCTEFKYRITELGKTEVA